MTVHELRQIMMMAPLLHGITHFRGLLPGFNCCKLTANARIAPKTSSLRVANCSLRTDKRQYVLPRKIVESLLDREWLLPNPLSPIDLILFETKFGIARRASDSELELFVGNEFNHATEPKFEFEAEHGLGNESRVMHDDDNDNVNKSHGGMARMLIIRDDLLHPLMGGNKLRKLDSIIPLISKMGATDVVTCGGCQSAHAAAVGVACAERGIRCHVLLRGEAPKLLTGYALISKFYANVKFISRVEYADRKKMFQQYSSALARPWDNVKFIDHFSYSDFFPQSPVKGILDTSSANSVSTMNSYDNHNHINVDDDDTTTNNSDYNNNNKNINNDKSGNNNLCIVVMNEGAGEVEALLGLVRCVFHFAARIQSRAKNNMCFVIDSGTGTTATGIALGIKLLNLPWRVVSVMLADTKENYLKHQHNLVEKFFHNYMHLFQGEIMSHFQAQQNKFSDFLHNLPIEWIDRIRPRKFGKIFPEEVSMCEKIAKETSILFDPIYTLSAWEVALEIAKYNLKNASNNFNDSKNASDVYHARNAAGSTAVNNKGKGLVMDDSSETMTHVPEIDAGEWQRFEQQEVSEASLKSMIQVGLNLVNSNDETVVILHTGGTLGMFGLAQRYPHYF